MQPATAASWILTRVDVTPIITNTLPMAIVTQGHAGGRVPGSADRDHGGHRRSALGDEQGGQRPRGEVAMAQSNTCKYCGEGKEHDGQAPSA